MLANGIVTESNSAWHSPVVLVKKSDGKSYRFAVDYRKLNAITKPQCFPLPRLQDIFDALGTILYISRHGLCILAGEHGPRFS